MNHVQARPTVEEQAAELESMIMTNGLNLAKTGGLNQANLPGLDRALDLLKLRRRRRATKTAVPEIAAPEAIGVTQWLAETKNRHRQLADILRQSMAAVPPAGDAAHPVQVPGQVPLPVGERQAA